MTFKTRSERCRGCRWNNGVAYLLNAFNIKVTFRNCGYFGYIETWKINTKCTHRPGEVYHEKEAV